MTERARQRESETERERDREGERQKERAGETERQRGRDREGETEREREGEREGERQRGREGEKGDFFFASMAHIAAAPRAACRSVCKASRRRPGAVTGFLLSIAAMHYALRLLVGAA